MKPFLTAVWVALGTFMAPQIAAAAEHTGNQHLLSFVAETTIPGPGGDPLALCQITRRYSLLFVPVFYRNAGYALAENRCATTGYQPLDPALFDQAQLLGLIAADLPSVPRLGFAARLVNLTIPAAALSLIIGALAMIRIWRRPAAPQDTLGAAPIALEILEVMCHMVKANGRTTQDAVARVARLSEQLTGTPFTAQQIARMAAACESGPQRADFRRLGANMDAAQKEALLRAALILAASDGHIGKWQQEYIADLAVGFAIRSARVKEILQTIRIPAAPA